MRTPAHIQQQTRRGLQVVFQRNPLSTKTAQQPQGLKIITVAASPAQLSSASSTSLTAEHVAWSENFFFRALAQLREGLSNIFPKAAVVATGVVAAQQCAPSPVLCEAALEPMGSSASIESADAAMTEILAEASRTPQPLIFSAHNIESYMASRKLTKTSSHPMASDTASFAVGEAESTTTPYGAAAGILHHIVKQYVLLPVVTLNRKVMKTTQSTLGTITVAFTASSTSDPADGRKRAQTNWVRVGLSFAAIVVAYDAAILAVTYAFMF